VFFFFFLKKKFFNERELEELEESDVRITPYKAEYHSKLAVSQIH